MNVKHAFALASGLLVAACAASTEPTDGTDTTGTKPDTAEKTEKPETTQSTSEPLVAPICGSKTCGAGTHCCGCYNNRFCARICPDIACAAL